MPKSASKSGSRTKSRVKSTASAKPRKRRPAASMQASAETPISAQTQPQAKAQRGEASKGGKGAAPPATTLRRRTRRDEHDSSNARPTRTVEDRASKPPVRKQRRALSHVGGRIVFTGDPAFEEACHRALTQRADEDEVRAHVHGFHPYPARLHPKTARALIEGLSQAGDTVLDPFCGSGTVLVESLIAARQAWGTDLNPLATALTKTKCRGASPAERKSLLESAAYLREFADERRQDKAGPTRKYSPDERALFDIHVLLELDSIRAGIEELAAGARKLTLQLILSSLLVKLSRKESDTVEDQAPRRFAAGYPAKLFLRRTEEWVRRLSEFESMSPAQRRTYDTWTCDARTLAPVDSNSVNLIVTSPPYPGVYDYYAHHAMRFSWLSLNANEFQSKELGAKRTLSRAKDPAAAWRQDLTEVFQAFARVLQPGALACVVMADSAIDTTLLRADTETRQAISRIPLDIVAHAKQARPLFHRASERAYQNQARFEHLLVLRRG